MLIKFTFTFSFGFRAFVSLFFFVPKENWQINRGKKDALNEFIIHFFNILLIGHFVFSASSLCNQLLMRAQGKVVNEIKQSTTVITALHLTEKKIIISRYGITKCGHRKKNNKNKVVIGNTIYCLSRASFHFHRFESALRITVFAFFSLSRSEMPESQFRNESICRWECWEIFSREIEKHQENAIKNLNETKTFKEFHCDSHDFLFFRSFDRIRFLIEFQYHP